MTAPTPDRFDEMAKRIVDDFVIGNSGLSSVEDMQVAAIAAALRSMLPPKGSILDDGGVVRRVLGTLPVTADGFVPGIGSRMFYTHGGEVFEVGVLPERVDDCYSTSFAAAEASAAPVAEELRKGEGQ